MNVSAHIQHVVLAHSEVCVSLLCSKRCVLRHTCTMSTCNMATILPSMLSSYSRRQKLNVSYSLYVWSYFRDCNTSSLAGQRLEGLQQGEAVLVVLCEVPLVMCSHSSCAENHRRKQGTGANCGGALQVLCELITSCYLVCVYTTWLVCARLDTSTDGQE